MPLNECNGRALSAPSGRHERKAWSRSDSGKQANGRRRRAGVRSRTHRPVAAIRLPQGGYTPSPSGTGAGGTDLRSLREGLMRLPTVPVERNVLLGSWRLEGGGQQSRGGP